MMMGLAVCYSSSNKSDDEGENKTSKIGELYYPNDNLKEKLRMLLKMEYLMTESNNNCFKKMLSKIISDHKVSRDSQQHNIYYNTIVRGRIRRRSTIVQKEDIIRIMDSVDALNGTKGNNRNSLHHVFRMFDRYIDSIDENYNPSPVNKKIIIDTFVEHIQNVFKKYYIPPYIVLSKSSISNTEYVTLSCNLLMHQNDENSHINHIYILLKNLLPRQQLFTYGVGGGNTDDAATHPNGMHYNHGDESNAATPPDTMEHNDNDIQPPSNSGLSPIPNGPGSEPVVSNAKIVMSNSEIVINVNYIRSCGFILNSIINEEMFHFPHLNINISHESLTKNEEVLIKYICMFVIEKYGTSFINNNDNEDVLYTIIHSFYCYAIYELQMNRNIALESVFDFFDIDRNSTSKEDIRLLNAVYLTFINHPVTKKTTTNRGVGKEKSNNTRKKRIRNYMKPIQMT
jgi:hypothetical protein